MPSSIWDILKVMYWERFRNYWKKNKVTSGLIIASISFLVYGYITLIYELDQGWNGHQSLDNWVERVSQFIPVGTAGSAIIIGGFDVFIFLSDWFLEKLKERKEIVRTIGRLEGIKEAEERISQQLADWERRREEAAASGEYFTEPLPQILQQSDEGEQSSTE